MSGNTNGRIQGDSHRFGKRVNFLKNAPTVLKPRNVDLEYLFLDPSSPLAPYSEIMGLSFNSKITPINSWQGECENLHSFCVSDEELEKNKITFFQLAGKFFATATLLGLNDLHHENILLINKNGKFALAPIDIEVIYYHFVSGAETALIPSVKTPDKTCGLQSLLKLIDEETFVYFLESFIDSWLKLNLLLPEILNIVDQFLETTPVRMILRPTKKYSEFLKTHDENIFQAEPLSLVAEEREQLDALDIPYFFSPFKRPTDLSYFSSADKISHAPNIKNHPSIKRHLNQKKTLSDETEIKKIFLHTFSHLIVHMGPKNQDKKSISSPNFKIEYFDDVIKFEVMDQVVNLKIK